MRLALVYSLYYSTHYGTDNYFFMNLIRTFLITYELALDLLLVLFSSRPCSCSTSIWTNVFCVRLCLYWYWRDFCNTKLVNYLSQKKKKLVNYVSMHTGMKSFTNRIW